LSEVWEYDAAVKSRFLRCNKSSVSMKDFWLSCGHHLTDRNAGGGLLVTDEFVKSYLARPELIPPPGACVAERALHAVLADPCRHIARKEIARSDAFDMTLDLTAGQRGLAKLDEVMTRWIKYMLAIDVEIEPVTEMRDVGFNWYLGLDACVPDPGDDTRQSAAYETPESIDRPADPASGTGQLR
jgi:hypothetical protein